MAFKWYVIHAYSGFEPYVMRTLRDRIKLHGMEDQFGEILVPTEEVVEMRDGKKRKSDRKFFLYPRNSSGRIDFGPVRFPGGKYFQSFSDEPFGIP